MTSVGLWDIPGQGHAAAVLRRAVARGEVGHAWAFLGPPAVGQQAAARALAAALNCPRRPEPGQGCGDCPVCRRCVRGTYGAYQEFVPTGAVHRVDEVRERWLHSASRSTVEGTWKVLRVCDADRMNEPSANAFLKALEEPPPGTVWLLDVADPDELPDTILSRCRTVRFSPWSASELDAEAARLGLADPTERALAVRAAHGSPTVLARLAADGGLDDLRRHRDILRRLRSDGPGYALVAARELADEVRRRTAALREDGKAELAVLSERHGEQLPAAVRREAEARQSRLEREARGAVAQAALDDLLAWLRDCLLVATGGSLDDAVHVDAPAALRDDADAFDPAALLRAADRVLAARADLEGNVGQGLAIEALLMDLSAVALRR